LSPILGRVVCAPVLVCSYLTVVVCAKVLSKKRVADADGEKVSQLKIR